MKKVITVFLISGILFSISANAREYKTWAYGKTAGEACQQLKKDLWSQARHKCRGKGGLKEALAGGCDTDKKSEKSYKARGKIVFSCNGK